ncbi:MAG: hypothetical protein IKD31_04500 [Clostridia bacterium]|nr:hypothetical protein [Clostridia bacterium]
MAKNESFFSLSRLLADLGECLLYRPLRSFSSAQEEKAANPKEKFFGRFPAQTYRIKIKTALAKASEQSFFVGLFRKGIRELLLTRIRSFGILFFICGFLQILSYFAGEWLPLVAGDQEHLLFGVSLLFITILCVFSRWNVAEGLRRSFLFCSVVKPFFGVREWKIPRAEGEDHLGYMVFFGMLFGGLSVFFSPLLLLRVLLWLSVLCFVLCFPEAGLALCGAGCLFLEREQLIFLIAATALSLFLKSCVGKRSLVFSPMDPVVVLALLPVLFSSVPQRASTFLSLLLIYFASAGLLRSLDSADRFLSTLCFAAFSASAFLVCREMILLFRPTLFLNHPFLETFFFIKPTAELGCVLAMLLPLAVGRIRLASSFGQRAFCLLTVFFLLAGLFFVRNSSLWMTVAVTLVVYLLFSSRFSLVWITVTGLLIYLATRIFPVSVFEQLLSAFGFRIGGIALGEKTAGLFSLIRSVGGIWWLLLVALLLGFYVFELLRLPHRSRSEDVHARVLASFCSVAAFLCICVQGVLPDYRLFVLLFLLLSFPRAMSRISEREEIRLPY